MEGDKKVIIKENIYKQLKKVIDPEIGINIVDLGLIYDISIDTYGEVVVKMTLTAPNCPYGDVLLDKVHRYTSLVEGVETVDIDLTFDPPWDANTHVSDAAKYYMGIL